MRTKFIVSTLLIFAMALAGCAAKPATPSKSAPTTTVQGTESTTTMVSPTETSIPAKTPVEMATPAMTDTPATLSTNMLTVNDQTDQSGKIQISLVTAEKPGWVVIFTDNNGQPGNVLGYVPVPAGTSSNVEVPVDPKQATSKMVAALLVDAGNLGTFEYPGPDTFAIEAGDSVMMVFNKTTG